MLGSQRLAAAVEVCEAVTHAAHCACARVACLEQERQRPTRPIRVRQVALRHLCLSFHCARMTPRRAAAAAVGCRPQDNRDCCWHAALPGSFRGWSRVCMGLWQVRDLGPWTKYVYGTQRKTVLPSRWLPLCTFLPEAPPLRHPQPGVSTSRNAGIVGQGWCLTS